MEHRMCPHELALQIIPIREDEFDFILYKSVNAVETVIEIHAS